MPHEFSRNERVAEQVRRELSMLLRGSVKDPRVSDVVIMEVEVSKDLAYARIFYTLFDESKAKIAQEGLERASGFLRRELGRALRLRMTPALRFFFDDTQQRGSEISALIDKALADDRSKHQGD